MSGRFEEIMKEEFELAGLAWSGLAIRTDKTDGSTSSVPIQYAIEMIKKAYNPARNILQDFYAGKSVNTMFAVYSVQSTQ